jgi:hypothetical protein
MRKTLLAIAALALLPACRSKQKQESVARSTDSSVRITVATNGPMTFQSGVLIAPIKVTNLRDRFVEVVLDRCEIEDTNGDRRKRRVPDGKRVMVSPGKTGTLKLIFGDSSNKLAGDAFRIWLWVQPTDGTGVLEGVPPLVFDTSGSAKFAAPPQGFTNANAPKDMLPPPTEPPPNVAPVAPGADCDPCKTCGEPRPRGSSSCPHCGLP